MQSVAEGDGNVEVCVELVGATLARSVAITLTPQPRTACKFNTSIQAFCHSRQL